MDDEKGTKTEGKGESSKREDKLKNEKEREYTQEKTIGSVE